MKFFILLAALILPVSAVTLDVVTVWLPLSLHHTDSVGQDMGEEAVQAGVFPRPMVLSGAFPEILVESAAQPFRLTGTERYEVEECNLFQLCGILLKTDLGAETLAIQLDVENMSIPAEVDLTAETILKICIQAIEKTLRGHPMAEGETLPCEFTIVGTTEKNQGLTALNRKFILGAE